MTKEQLQKETLDIVKCGEKNNLALLWCTSLGKSKMAIDIAKKVTTDKSKILLVVAEIAHKKNWKEEFDKWKFNTKNVVVTCYASLKNYENTQWDIIIYDEAHHLKSDIRTSIIKTIKSNNVVLLSATMSIDLLSTLNRIYGNFEVSRFPLDKAIKLGIIPEPKIYLIPLRLCNVPGIQTIEESWGLKNKRVNITCSYNDRWKYMKDRKKYPNVNLTIECTAGEKYLYLNTQFEYYKNLYMETYKYATKIKWLRIGSERKRFLGECKDFALVRLLPKLENKRYICFCSSIKQTSLVGNSKNAIHSKNKNSLNIINNFNLKKINKLFAVGMLQEGQNLKDIEAGVIVQLDGEERSFIQKFGRTCRAEDPIQFILYFENTRDEEFLNNVINNIDSQYIVKLDISDFTL